MASEQHLKPQFLLGAAASGSGKTTLTLGLLRAFRNRGWKVQPFKCGPDYLDTQHHKFAAGRDSLNLDSFLASPRHIKEIYGRYSEDADICLTEGVMGLFDGYDRMHGSSAEIASILHLPVILVLKAQSTAYSIAPVLYGFKHFCPDLSITGVIFNLVGSENHYHSLEQACKDVGIECLGYLPKDKNIEIPSRYLGLKTDSKFCFDEFSERIARLVEKTVRIDRLLEISQQPLLPVPSGNEEKVKSSCRISVARDRAFHFIYPANLHRLQQHGEVSFFSPLEDAELPPSDLVYLPGGYPELYLPELSANKTMLASIYRYCKQGGKLFAECGGMMYLGKSITDLQGCAFPMCGFLPQETTLQNMHLHLGYRRIVMNGQEYRGHEFHYSQIKPESVPLPSVASVFNTQGKETHTSVFRLQNVIASYIHFYWGEKKTDFPLF